MSRHGYSDCCDDNWRLIMWRGAVASATKGARGQAMLRDLLAALDAMPVKRLITGQLQVDGDYCTLGALGAARGLPLPKLQSLDGEDWDIEDDAIDDEELADMFNVAPALAREIMFENDEGCHYDATPERRWSYMRQWVAGNIKQ
jgi:hypothetical protein